MFSFVKKIFFVCLAIVFTSLSANSQEYKITGKILDIITGQPLIGANVIVTSLQDTLNKSYGITDANGTYIVQKLYKGSFKVTASYMGYNKVDRNIILTFRNQFIDNILLSPKVEELKQVTIIGNPPPTVIKGDTTEFNAAAFKVNPDANVEDLVKKMPGVTIEEGTVKAQGEDVKKVLVDGKPFFGDDPSVALKNLPAELVERVQVFDQQSEQSQLTGFNDGETTKTMNIITRTNKRNGQFGKFTVAYGDQDRYLLGANANKFSGEQRISFVATTNNINQQNFATQDFLGAMGNSGGGRNQRRPSGGPSGGQGGGQGGERFGGQSNFSGQNQNGINSINSIGLNYSNTFNEHLSLSGSYFFNNNNNSNAQVSNTEYILSSDSSRLEDAITNSTSQNYNNRLNFRVEYFIDTMNTLIFQPSLNFQSNTSDSRNKESQDIKYLELITPLNKSDYTNNTKTTGYNFSNRLTYRHRFAKTGRTASVDMNTTLNKRDPYNTSYSDVYYYSLNKSTLALDTTNTLTDRINATTTDGYSINANIAYTEPIGKISQVQINFRNSYQNNYSYKQTSDLDSLVQKFFQVDSLSNKYDNVFITSRLGLSYRLKTPKLNASAGFELQNSSLSGDQTYPKTASTNKSFPNFLPNAQMNYRVSQQNNLIVNYNTNTNPPSISQLQNVSEYNANLTRKTIGNPNLEPQYTHNVFTRFTSVNREKGSNFFVLLGGSVNQNSIGNSTIYLDTIQIVMPVNKGTGYNMRTFANYGFPIKAIKCNMNFSGGYNYGRTPGFVNGKSNVSTTNTFTSTLVFSSNISEKIDFTLSTSGSYNLVDNTVSTQSNNNYYSQNSSFKFNWIFWKNLTFQNDISSRFYKGLSTSDYNQNIWVVNLGLGKKFMKNNAGEVRLTVYDLFNQNISISRTITANAITDQQSKILSRYVMASFIYTFRAFKFGSEPGRGDGQRRREGFDGPPPGDRPPRDDF